jgi:outer membrane protein assembly factor BamE (lipoprotein component of BamABCDE complex)
MEDTGYSLNVVRSLKFSICVGLSLLALGCVNARDHYQDVHSSTEPEMTVGIVQREIRRGMTPDEVAGALGSPNLVNRDQQGNETWIYDKIATVATYSRSSGGSFGLGGVGGSPGSSLLLGLGGGSYQRNAGASATTQKTLTVIIKYGADGRVRDFTYHSSKF